jgi:hypothetical protein
VIRGCAKSAVWVRAACLAASALIATSLASGVAAAVLINGDFESGLTGWTLSPGATIAVLSGSAYQGCCGTAGTPAQLANHFAAFAAGNVASVGTISQSITLAAGADTVDFQTGAVAGSIPEGVTATIAGGAAPVFGSLAYTPTNDFGTVFRDVELTFVSTGAPITISFAAAGALIDDNTDGVIDNVAIAAVPEPATWTPLLAGFAGPGAATRALRRKAISLA